MFCPNCGAEHPECVHFCAACGAALREDAAQVRSAALSAAGLDPDTPAAGLTPALPDAAQLPFAPAPAASGYSAAFAMPPVRRRRRRWQIPVLAVLLAALVVLLVQLPRSDVRDSREAVAEAYLACFADHDADGIYELLLPAAAAFIAERDRTDAAGVLRALDDWFWAYGTGLTHWQCTDVLQFSDEELQQLGALLDCELTQWSSVCVEVVFADGAAAEMQIEVVEYQGEWYLLEVLD